MADSLETKAIVKYMVDSGTPHIRSSFHCAGHSSSGYHCLPGTGAIGTACDFQDPAPRDAPGLLAIFNTFLEVETQLVELIYSGAAFSIKNGKRTPRYAIDAHWLHVHSAVKLGVIINWPAPEVVRPMYDPPFFIPGGVAAHLKAPGGGVWVVGHEGHIYAFDAPDFGRPAGQSYWGTRKAAKLVPSPNGQGYTVVSTSNERYTYE